MSTVQPSPPQDRLGRGLHDLRLSVIEACNFRCGYCMPADQVPDDHGLNTASRLSFAQIERLVRAFVRLGVSKLRLTGGEPLLRKGLPDLIARLAEVPGLRELTLTTNGSLLQAQAAALKQAGLHRLTVSLDALDADVLAFMSGGRGRVQDVLAGIEAAAVVGLAPIKINCVVQRGVNERQIMPLLDYFRGTGHVLRFIEYMDVGTRNQWRRDQMVPSVELRRRIAARWPLQRLPAQYRGEVAERYAFEDGQGEIGFISSLTGPFCGDCQRARVSAQGHLYTCLFAEHGVDLRPALAQGEPALLRQIASLWQQRQDRYSEQRDQPGHRPGQPIEMYLIGG